MKRQVRRRRRRRRQRRRGSCGIETSQKHRDEVEKQGADMDIIRTIARFTAYREDNGRNFGSHVDEALDLYLSVDL